MCHWWSSISVLPPVKDKVQGGDMEYTVVAENNRDELVRKVADLIKQGWKPLGGISVSTVAPILGNYMFCQALIKEHP